MLIENKETPRYAVLGAVHGLASPLGAYFPVPHGVVCGTLVAAATEVNILAMQARDATNPALAKYAQVDTVLKPKSQDLFNCEKRIKRFA